MQILSKNDRILPATDNVHFLSKDTIQNSHWTGKKQFICLCVNMYNSAHVEVRGQRAVVSSLLSETVLLFSYLLSKPRLWTLEFPGILLPPSSFSPQEQRDCQCVLLCPLDSGNSGSRLHAGTFLLEPSSQRTQVGNFLTK